MTFVFLRALYFRLAVVKDTLPPLRQRPEDIPMIVEGLLPTLGADLPAFTKPLTPEFIANLQRSAWPGNLRELRNYLQLLAQFERASLRGPLAVLFLHEFSRSGVLPARRPTRREEE